MAMSREEVCFLHNYMSSVASEIPNSLHQVFQEEMSYLFP
jgi:hypothetical protein